MSCYRCSERNCWTNGQPLRNGSPLLDGRSTARARGREHLAGSSARTRRFYEYLLCLKLHIYEAVYAQVDRRA